jgi:hypothetical protein
MFQLPPNPRYDNIPAISWSDLLAIEKSPEAFLAGVRLSPNRSMQYGTHIHTLISKKKIKNIPHGNSPEKIYTCIISDGKIKFMIVGRPDDSDDDTIYEYKTSLGGLWSRLQAEKHGQLFTYALLKWKTTGILPKKALLVSLETENVIDMEVMELDLKLTKNVRIIEVPITLKDVLMIQTRFIKAYKKLEEVSSLIS